MSYLGTRPSNQTPTYRQVYEFTATANQTTFSVSYTVGFVSVFRNGVQLGSANFTATNGTSVVLTSGCNAGDYVRIESLFTANVQGAIPNTAGAVVTSNIADGAITTAKIANGAVIQADLASGVAGTGPAFSAFLNSSQTVSSNTFTKVTLNAEEYDTANAFDSTTNYRFTPQVAGYYQFNAMVSILTTTCNIIPALYKNGSAYMRNQNLQANSESVSGSWMIYLNGSTDYVELYVSIATGQGLQNGSSPTSRTALQGFLARAA